MSADEDEDWTPRRRVAPQFVGDLLPADPAREFDEEEMYTFFSQLAEGYGPLMIGLSLGWSKAQVDRFVNEPGRAQIIDMITEARHESVERAIEMFAKAGNATAMKLYAFNKMAHRGWADRREVRQVHGGQVELVASVRQALDEHTRGRVAEIGAGAIAELQSFLLDDDEDIVDAEVIEQ